MSGTRNRIAPLIPGYATLLEADAELIELFGGTPYIRQRNTVQAIQTIPGIYWSLFPMSLRENFWSGDSQWDAWAESFDMAIQISDRLAAVMHRENALRVINGVRVLTTLTDVEEGPDEGRVTSIFHHQPTRA